MFSEKVSFLVSNGANLNLADKFGWTPLHVAVFFGHFDIVQRLLLHRPSSKYPGLRPAVTNVRLHKNDNVYGASWSGVETPLHLAVRAKSLRMVRTLVLRDNEMRNALGGICRHPTNLLLFRVFSVHKENESAGAPKASKLPPGKQNKYRTTWESILQIACGQVIGKILAKYYTDI